MDKKPRFDRIITLILVALCIGLAITIAYKTLNDEQNDQGFMPPPNETASTVINVSVESVEPTTFIKTTTMGAELKSSMEDITLTSTIAGKLTALYIQKGDVITSGDIIATVDPSNAGNIYKPSNIISEVSGTVYSVDTYVGAQINTSTSLATLGKAGELEVVANISERYLSTLQKGMKATFSTAAWSDESMSASVKSISPSVNSTNRTIEVTLSIDEKDDRLKEGMFVRLSLITEQIPNSLVIPSDAISTYLGEPVVYIVQEGKAKRVAITTSSSDDNKSVVTSGLVGGEQIIVAGSVVDGTSVKVIEE